MKYRKASDFWDSVDETVEDSSCEYAYPSRKGKNDHEGDSDINRPATATTGPGHTNPGGKAVVLVSEDGATSLVSVVQAVPAKDPRSKAAANGQGM